MDAHLTVNMELTPFFKLPSSQLIGSLGSVAPIVLMILLLLLCFPFKKKKHRLSIRTRKKDLSMSELIELTKLEDGLSPERSLFQIKVYTKLYSFGKKDIFDVCGAKYREMLAAFEVLGNTLPSHQTQEQSNGFSSELQQANADSPKYTQEVNSSQQTMEKLNMKQHRNLSPQAAGSNIPSTSPLQFRKLPVTPKEAYLSKMLPSTQNLDNLIYESIGIKEQELYSKDWLEERTGCQMVSSDNLICSTTHGVGAEPVVLGGKDSEVEGSNNMPVQLSPAQPCQESHGQLQEIAPEKEAPQAQLESDSRRLSAMYARVCKRTKASQPVQPENCDESKEHEEEEPPPIPEKCFEHIYESLNVDGEMQDGGL